MIYLLIFFGVCLVIGPILWLQPSRADKRRAQLRSDALAKGLEVNLAAMPRLERAIGEESKTFDSVVYRMPWRREDRQRSDELGTWTCVREAKTADSDIPLLWRWKEKHILSEEVQSHLSELLSQFPADVSAVESNRHGLSVYWRERGERSDVDQILMVLQQIRQNI